MRFSLIEINFDYPNEPLSDKYVDMLVSNRNSVHDESDLKDDYFEWKYEKDFQWFYQQALFGGDSVLIVFYESHPLFNCYVFYEALKDNPRGVKSLKAAENFILPFYNRWVRREKAKLKREEAAQNRSI